MSDSTSFKASITILAIAASIVWMVVFAFGAKSLMNVIILLTLASFIAWSVLLMLGIKEAVLRVAAAAIIAALLFQIAARVHLGFWDPLAVVALFTTIPVTFVTALFLELLRSRFKNK